MKMFVQALLIFSLLISASTTEASSVVDFCVADTSLPNGPAGFSCKHPAQVVADNFVYSLATKGNTSHIFRASVNSAVAPAFPGVNGLGISIERVDVEVGGVVPFHTHRATEITLVIQGTLIAGFVSSYANQVYIKTLRRGDVMVFPQGMMHFLINIGKAFCPYLCKL